MEEAKVKGWRERRVIDSKNIKGPSFTELIEDMVINKAKFYDYVANPT